MTHTVIQQDSGLGGLGQALFENAPDPLLLVDAESDLIIGANGRAASLLRRDRSSLSKLRLADLVADLPAFAKLFPGGPDSEYLAAAAVDAMRQAPQSAVENDNSLAGNAPGNGSDNPPEADEPLDWPTAQLLTGDGSLLPVELTTIAAGYADRNVILVVLRDLTASRRRAEIEQLFHDSPVSLWEFDWSRVRQKIRDWTESGISDLRSWLEADSQRVAELARETRIVSVNRGTLRMYGARDLADFRDHLATVFREDSLDAFRRHLLARLDGQTRVEVDNVTYTLQGERRYSRVIATAAAGSEDSWERLYTSVFDITERKQAQLQQETQRLILEQLVASDDAHAALQVLTRQVKRQAPELTVAVFRLPPDQQTIELADAGSIPEPLTRLLTGRHWKELAPLIEDWHVDDLSSKVSPTQEIAADSSTMMSSLLGRLGAAVLAAGYCDCALETVRNAQGVPLGIILFLRSGSGPFRQHEKDVIANVRRLAAITFDHERDRAELALRTSELQSLFCAYPDVLLRLNRDGTIVEHFGGDIPGLLSIKGQRLLSNRVWNVVPRGVGDWLREAIGKLQAGSYQETFEFEHQSGAESRSVEIRVVPLSASGDLLAILRDITVLKQTEQALAYASERFRHVFESSPDAIFVESTDGRILDVNPAACELHCMSRDELLACRVADLVPEHQRDEISNTAREILSRGHVSFDGYSIRQDGREIPVDIRASSVTFDGQPALLFHVRDATRRVAQEKLRREQERQVAHLSRLSLMGQFVAGIAHEIRQPLWSISTFAAVVAESLDRPDSLERLDRVRNMTRKIVSEVGRVNNITSRMFSFAKKSLPKREAAVLQEIVQTVTGLCTPALRDKKIELTVDVPSASIDVVCDRVLIEQTLVNLLTNASRAVESVPTRTGQIEVRLTTDGDTATISVVDNGCGLPGDTEAEQLFEGFFTTDHAGLGIGLALSRSFVEEHGGRIWAEPNADAGMSFHFTLKTGLEAGNT